MTDPVRMTRCVYLPEGKRWIPMGRARTRCPSCGAELKEESEGDYHTVQMRIPTPNTKE